MTGIRDLRDRFLTAVATNDVAAVLKLYRDDAVLIAPEGRFKGHDYIGAYYRSQFAAFSGLELTVRDTHDSGNVGVAEWVFAGTNTGPLELPGGEAVPPTGKRVTQRGADVAIVEGGLLREHRLYYDQLELLDQLGLPATRQG
jgi:ketosteroid isomerase-like protein